MKPLKNIFALTAAILLSCPLFAQDLTQTVRGTVTDKHLQTPLKGANISIPAYNMGTTTDDEGNFSIPNVPVGRTDIKVSYVGYAEVTLSGILITTGKETVLSIAMEEKASELSGVKVSGKNQKHKLANDMAAPISARSFSVEETQKYAAAVNDPGRMATSFAGVVGADDGSNFIVIRGNAPNGLLWRMEGVDVPNPNHFANPGTSGGGISILSAQLMANSDFMTGAFSAEYGNALSGVFDMRMRKGNNQKREYTFQAGVLGIDVATEGPFSKKYKGSYLVNYRYSTLGILTQAGVLNMGGVTTFQDLSFNLNLPAGKAGTFTWFGFGGLSRQVFKAKADSSKWKSEYDRWSNTFFTNTGATGITHTIKLTHNATLRTILSASNVENGDMGDRIEDDYNPRPLWKNSFDNGRLILSSTVTQKQSARSTLRYGIIASNLFYNLSQKERKTLYSSGLTELVNTKGNTQTAQAFMQWKYRFAGNFTLNAGLHSLYLFLNNSYAVEPRAAVRWDINHRNALSAGMGIHSQIQPMGFYFAEAHNPDGSLILPNKNLGFSKARHFILAYDRNINRWTKFKAETYYQQLYNIPVDANKFSSMSVINMIGGYPTDSAANKGTGRNYGLELTFDRALNKGYYLLMTMSLYDSKYKGSDGVLRNTRWNGRHAFTTTAGKEIILNRNGKNKIIGFNLKSIWSGGFRETPINIEESRLKGRTVYEDSKAWTLQIADYFRTDIRISMKTNHKHFTGTLALDIQNVTNNKNVYGRYYEPQTEEIKTQYQLSLLPILSYKVEF